MDCYTSISFNQLINQNKQLINCQVENLKSIENSINLVNYQLNQVKNRRDFKDANSLSTLLESRINESSIKEEKETSENSGEQSSSDPSPELAKGHLVIEMVHKNADAVDIKVYIKRSPFENFNSYSLILNNQDLTSNINRIQEYKDNPKEAMNLITKLKKTVSIFIYAPVDTNIFRLQCILMD